MAQFSFQYAAKFLCISNIPGTSQTTTSVVPGSYQTVVNIHNPHYETIDYRMKLALGDTNISKFVPGRLRPDGMTRVTCNRILREFFGGPDDVDFIHGTEGFLVIESTHSLDVVAVYTAVGEGGRVQSIDVETVKERCLELPAGGGCHGENAVNFEAEAPGPRPNPWEISDFSFSLTHPANQANVFVETIATHTGLNCGELLDIKLGTPVNSVQMRLVHHSEPAWYVATSNGAPVAPAQQMVNPPGVPEMVTIVGANIDAVQIRSPENEVLLLCFAAG
ncbi:hypothetical protein [Candidatus Entotheonella palauensis]|uniref:hypothetical protein n=1 Tax=Candidatus Entotheonella palauensis TaxID=93172 RepID=UPI000B7FC37D|nr:hypothetical protein [Candidatus Entotheonella palauensis]